MALLFGDTFVDTNGVDLPSHVPTGASAALSWGAGIFSGTNHMKIQANGATGGVAGFVEQHNVLNQSGAWPADVSIAFDAHFLTGTNSFPAVTLRHATASDECYGAQWGGAAGGWSIIYFNTHNIAISSTLTTIAYAYPGNGVTDHMIFKVQGSALEIVKNGTSFLTVTDTTIPGAGKPGVYGNGAAETATTGLHFEAFAVSDFITGRTFYLNNPIQGGSNAGLLDVAAPGASTCTTGWTVGATAVNQYSRQTYNQEVPTTGFTSTAQPSSAPVNLGEDCFRISGVTTGQFSAGTWYSSVSVIAVSSGGIQQGRGRFRLWASVNADGTAARELTQGTMIGSQVTELNTTVAQTSSASTQIAASNLTNEFLFEQIAWETL